jgi:hypothetical protein
MRHHKMKELVGAGYVAWWPLRSVAGRVMQDAGYELPRIPLLLGTWVNKGKRKAQNPLRSPLRRYPGGGGWIQYRLPRKDQVERSSPVS